jgi:hypothetical protein
VSAIAFSRKNGCACPTLGRWNIAHRIVITIVLPFCHLSVQAETSLVAHSARQGQLWPVHTKNVLTGVREIAEGSCALTPGVGVPFAEKPLALAARRSLTPCHHLRQLASAEPKQLRHPHHSASKLPATICYIPLSHLFSRFFILRSMC